MSSSKLVLRAAFACCVLAATFVRGQTNQQPVNLTVNTAITYQTVAGFGTALGSDSPVWTQKMVQDYTQDLGASILRIPLTPEILPTQVTLGPDLQTNVNLFNFNGNYPQTNWGGFAAAVTAQKMDQMKLIASIWTPPGWMKTSGSENGGALLQTPQNLQQFGRYVAAYVQGFQQTYGVPLYAVSIQNELRFSEPYPSTVYTPDQYVAALKAVGAEFAADGIKTKIMGPEDVGVDSGFLTNNQMSFINAVKADPVAKSYLSFYAVHGYSGNGSTASSQGANWADYNSRIAADGLQSWMTEESGENPAWVHVDSNGKPDGALAVALNMHEGLVSGNLNAWVYWQMDDGYSPVSNYTLTASSDPSSLKYNAFKHYSRFIRPGATRVDSSPDSPSGVTIDAWMDGTSHILTINLINASGTDEPVNVTLPNTDFASFAQYRTSATEPWAVLPDVTVINGVVSLTLPANSLVTLQSDAIALFLPEPTTAAALLFPAAALLLRRRRGHRSSAACAGA